MYKYLLPLFLLALAAMPQSSTMVDTIHKVAGDGDADPIEKVEIVKDTYKEVEYRFTTKSGSRQKATIKYRDIARIEFGENRKRSDYFAAMREMNKGSYENARKYFDKVISKLKDKPIEQYAAYYSARSYWLEGNSKSALSEYAKFISQYGKSSLVKKAYLDMCHIHIRARDVNSAKAVISKFKSTSSSLNAGWDAEIDMLQAPLYEGSGDWAKAEGIYRKYIRSVDAETQDQAIIGYIRTLQRQKKYGDLSSKCPSYIKSVNSPRVLAAAYNGLGDVDMDKARYSEAMLHYLRGVVQYRVPQTPEHEYALAKTVVAQSQFAATLKGEKKKKYMDFAKENLGNLIGMYPKSAYIKEATDAVNQK